MEIEIGCTVATKSVHNEAITGVVEHIKENTVILANGTRKYVVLKKTLIQAGHTVPETVVYED